MTFRTTPLCDEDIVNIYVRGVADFGIDQADAYHAGPPRLGASREAAGRPKLGLRALRQSMAVSEGPDAYG